MRWYGGKPVERQLSWLPLGLLLVALFLGHDALMATEAVAAPHVADEETHHAARPHAPQQDTPGLPGSAPEPGHPEQCGIGLSALPRSSNDFPVFDEALPSGNWCTAFPAPAIGRREALVWEEPHWPPGTLRALSQVYRI